VIASLFTEIGGTAALAATLPGTVELVLVTSGALLRPQRCAPLAPADCRLAVVIPAHNEAALIARCVQSIFDSIPKPEADQVVVIADNCTDETAALATAAGARVIVRTNQELRGKSHALRLGFETLSAEGFSAFLVIDADSLVSPNLLSKVLERLNSGAGAVQCRYQVANSSVSMRTRLMDVAFLAFNVLRPKGRAGFGLSCGVLGNGFALRADTLTAIPYAADSIVEDLEYHLRLVTHSAGTEFLNDATVYGEIPSGAEAARVQRSRWEGGRLRMAREWVPRLAAAVVSGKLSLLEPLLELLTLPLSYHGLLLISALLLPGIHRMFAVAGLAVVGVHVLVATWLADHPWKTLMALATAPFYVLWKLTTLDSVFSASRRNADWVRTGRDPKIRLTPAD